MKIKTYKHCPRCNTKLPFNLQVCPNCALNFNKFNAATNRAAKQALKDGEKQQILLRTGVPTDVNKIKLLLITIFLGFTGAHYYYVGRKGFGIFFSVFFTVGRINAIITTSVQSLLKTEFYQVFTMLVLIWGVVLLWWLFDVFRVVFNKFKIPVSVEIK